MALVEPEEAFRGLLVDTLTVHGYRVVIGSTLAPMTSAVDLILYGGDDLDSVACTWLLGIRAQRGDPLLPILFDWSGGLGAGDVRSARSRAGGVAEAVSDRNTPAAGARTPGRVMTFGFRGSSATPPGRALFHTLCGGRANARRSGHFLACLSACRRPLGPLRAPIPKEFR